MNKLERMILGTMVAGGLSGCAVTPATMYVTSYTSNDGAKVYLTQEQSHDQDVAEHSFVKMAAANDAYFQANPKDPRKKDWNKRKELNNHQDIKVVVQVTPEGVMVGYDGITQVQSTDQKYRDLATLNGILDTAERIPNYSVPLAKGEKPTDNHYTFTGDQFPRIQKVNDYNQMNDVHSKLLYQPTMRRGRK